MIRLYLSVGMIKPSGDRRKKILERLRQDAKYEIVQSRHGATYVLPDSIVVTRQGRQFTIVALDRRVIEEVLDDFGVPADKAAFCDVPAMLAAQAAG
ncbi:MAG TPA: hypothetical protein VMT99_02000 [Candidatus Paceibacterota bacterium]|nr:hypothetical protein [Candidatus Paceibacterota bacterium]